MNELKDQPLVSVLMTVYNREKYIEQAIESVMASTYQNWELIVVDDRSKDASVTVANDLAKQDSRIKVYVNEVNLGDYPNRNKAASYAKGKYLKYVDADDMIYPYGLEQCVFNMEQFSDAGYGLCSLKQDKDQMYPFSVGPEEAYKRQYVDGKSLFHKAPLSAIIRTSAFESLNGFTGKRMLGDFEMWHRLSQKFDVVLMPQGIVWYREHNEQEMSHYKVDPMFPFKYVLLSEEFLKHDACPLKDTKNALKRIQKKKAKAIISAVKHHSIKKAFELKKESGMSFLTILKKY